LWQGQEPINFKDVLCQMVDMVKPVDATSITLKDLTKPDKRQASGVLFDVLFNLHKFIRFETRDPFQEKQKRDDPFR
jgi:serine/threonine-protein phosphatase 2A regulatory subunit B''